MLAPHANPAVSGRGRGQARPWLALLGCLLLLLLGPRAAWGQEEATLPRDLTISWVEQRLADAQAADVDEATKAVTVGQLQQALEQLRLAEEWNKKAAEFERLSSEAPALLASIRDELARPPEEPAPAAPLDAKLTQLEQLRVQAEAQALAARELAEQVRAESARRVERRAALADGLARQRQQLSELDEAQRAPSPPNESSALGLARRALAQARLLALSSEMRCGERELASYDARADLLPARRDRAQRRLGELERLAASWQALVDARRRQESDAAARGADRLRREAAMRTPELTRLGEETQALADERTGEAGLNTRIERAGKALTETRRELAELRERFRSVRRREQAAGLTDAMGVILRRFHEELPAAGDLQRHIRATQSQLAEAELRAVLLEEQRVEAGDIDRALQGLERRLPDQAEIKLIARDLLVQRRDLLDSLVADTDRLLTRLIELDAAQRELESGAAEFRAYVGERILWIRSVQGRGFPAPGASWDAISWLVANPSLGQAFGATRSRLRDAQEEAAAATLALLVLLALGLSAWRLDDRLGLAPSFPLTVQKLVTAVLRAAPGPGVLYVAGWLLGRPPDQVEFGIALGAGLRHLALVTFVFAFAWQLLRRKGLSADFHWTQRGSKHVRKHLLWFAPIKVVTAGWVVVFDRQSTAAWNESLGRLAFLVGVLALAVFIQRVLRADSPLLQGIMDRAPTGWIVSLRRLWYPVLWVLPIALAGLALSGHYYTATRFEACFESSLVLVGVVLVLHALLLRWLLLAKRRLQASQTPSELARDVPAPATPAAGPADPGSSSPGQEGVAQPAEGEPDPLAAAAPPPEPLAAPPPEPSRPASSAPPPSPSASSTFLPPGPNTDDRDLLDLAAIRQQTGKLFRGIVAVCLLVGLASIWGEVLPALVRLEQVQIWPSLNLVEPPPQSFPVLERVASTALQPIPPARNGGDPAVEPTPSPMIPVPGASLATPAVSEASSLPARVTLADLGLALLVFVVTLVFSKNLPGFLEIVLLERLPLDAGARYAVITVTRYLLVIVGVSAGFGRLGIGWSSIQWLAAALTFGLAFGLQEVFANFVSGLILLAERPIRVGDVVTVSGVNGKVARIRIRATTIAQWNGKELILPNKNFVTGEVINWTLTEPRVRLEIPIGLGYGSDTDLAKRLLVEAARAHPHVLQDPPPNAFFIGFGPSALDFELRAWVPTPDYLPQTREDLLGAVQAGLRGADIQIAFPQHDLHLKSGELALRMVGDQTTLEAPRQGTASAPDVTAED